MVYSEGRKPVIMSAKMWDHHGSTTGRGRRCLGICLHRMPSGSLLEKGIHAMDNRMTGEVGGIGPLGDLSCTVADDLGEHNRFMTLGQCQIKEECVQLVHR